MNLFFLIQRLQLLVFCVDGLQLQLFWIVILSVFSCNSIKVNHYIQFFDLGCSINSSLHTISGPVSYGYDMTPSGVCILLLSFTVSAILLKLFS